MPSWHRQGQLDLYYARQEISKLRYTKFELFWLFMRVGEGWNLGQSFLSDYKAVGVGRLPFLEVFKTLMSYLNGAISMGGLLRAQSV
jgi:hypothetical protein